MKKSNAADMTHMLKHIGLGNMKRAPLVIAGITTAIASVSSAITSVTIFAKIRRDNKKNEIEEKTDEENES